MANVFTNHKLQQLTDTETGRGFKASWGYTQKIDSNDNHVVQHAMHADAVKAGETGTTDEKSKLNKYNKDNPKKSTLMKWSYQKTPGYVFEQGAFSIARETTSWELPNALLFSKFYPQTDWVLLRMMHDGGISPGPGKSVAAANDRFVSIEYKEPLPPAVELTGMSNGTTDLALTWRVSSNKSEMGSSTPYWRTETRIYLQKIVNGGKSWPDWKKYTMPKPATYRSNKGSGWYASFTGDSFDYTSPVVVESLTPATPVKVRVAAVNVGPSGASKITYGGMHVFAKVNTPVVTIKNKDGSKGTFIDDSKTTGGAMTRRFVVRVDAKDDGWHPVDELVLQRQIAAEMDENGSWTDVTKIQVGANKVVELVDTESAQMPNNDEATFWRIVAWHDDRAANQAVANLPNNPDTKLPWRVGTVTPPSNVTATPSQSGTAMSATWDWGGSGNPKSFTAQLVLGGKTLESKKLAGTARSCTFSTVLQSGQSYSVRVKATGLVDSVWVETASTGAPTVSVDAVNPDGVSVRFTETHDQSDGFNVTEWSWAGRSDAWESTEDPATKDVVSASTSSALTVVGLTPGEPVYVRARRKDSEGTFGPYSDTVTATPSSEPSKPVVSAPGVVAAGNGIDIAWDFTGFTQESATVKVLYPGESNPVNVPVDGLRESATIPTESGMSGNASVSVVVRAGGGVSEESDPVTILIAQPPTCTATFAGTMTDVATPSGEGQATAYGNHVLTAMPLSMVLGGSGDGWTLKVVEASESQLAKPDGTIYKAKGSVVALFSTSESGTSQDPLTVVESGIVGGSNYDVEVVCTDSSTGLSSEPVTLSFNATWARTAVAPSCSVEVSDGTARVTVTEGTGALSSDTLNIWRVTADGAYLVASDVESGEVYVDKVPPYGWSDCSYIAESVTADGDSKWSYGSYSLPSTGEVTFNWGEKSASLPWNIEWNDSYSTIFEARAHMDGSRNGFWQAGHDRSATTSGALKRDGQESLVNLLRELGSYDGLAFVRAKPGIAFPANVDVSIRRSYSSGILDVDISMTEVDDDGSWRAEKEQS